MSEAMRFPSRMGTSTLRSMIAMDSSSFSRALRIATSCGSGLLRCCAGAYEIANAANPASTRREILVRMRLISTGVRGRARSQFLAVGPGDFAGMRKVRSVARAPAEYRHCVAQLHGDVAPPSLADEHVGWKPFELPMNDVAVVVLDVNVEMDVRIFPVNLDDNTSDGDWFAFVVFGPKGMMRQRGRSGQKQAEADGNNRG